MREDVPLKAVLWKLEPDVDALIRGLDPGSTEGTCIVQPPPIPSAVQRLAQERVFVQSPGPGFRRWRVFFHLVKSVQTVLVLPRTNSSATSRKMRGSLQQCVTSVL